MDLAISPLTLHTSPQMRTTQYCLAPELSEDSGKEMSPSPGVRAPGTVGEHHVLRDAEAPGLRKRLR